MKALEGQVYVVAGGSGGIGGSIVRAFAAAGARLVIVDRHPDESAARAAGGIALSADLTKLADAESMVRTTLDRLGRLDGLIQTVGGFAMGNVHEVPVGDYDRMFDLNMRTLFHATRAVVPHFLATRAGFLAGFAAEPAWSGAGPHMSLYAASKAAVATFLRSVDAELAGTEARVAIVYPMGAVDTPSNRRDMPGFERFIDPAEIAATLLHAATRSPRGRLLELPVFAPR